MSRLTKSMLALMIINGVASLLFLTGLLDVGSFPGLYVAFPLAATFYGLFLISRIFEKDMARFDAEHLGRETKSCRQTTPRLMTQCMATNIMSRRMPEVAVRSEIVPP